MSLRVPTMRGSNLEASMNDSPVSKQFNPTDLSGEAGQLEMPAAQTETIAAGEPGNAPTEPKPTEPETIEPDEETAAPKRETAGQRAAVLREIRVALMRSNDPKAQELADGLEEVLISLVHQGVVPEDLSLQDVARVAHAAGAEVSVTLEPRDLTEQQQAFQKAVLDTAVSPETVRATYEAHMDVFNEQMRYTRAECEAKREKWAKYFKMRGLSQHVPAKVTQLLALGKYPELFCEYWLQVDDDQGVRCWAYVYEKPEDFTWLIDPATGEWARDPNGSLIPGGKYLARDVKNVGSGQGDYLEKAMTGARQRALKQLGLGTAAGIAALEDVQAVDKAPARALAPPRAQAPAVEAPAQQVPSQTPSAAREDSGRTGGGGGEDGRPEKLNAGQEAPAVEAPAQQGPSQTPSATRDNSTTNQRHDGGGDRPEKLNAGQEAQKFREWQKEGEQKRLESARTRFQHYLGTRSKVMQPDEVETVYGPIADMSRDDLVRVHGELEQVRSLAKWGEILSGNKGNPEDWRRWRDASGGTEQEQALTYLQAIHDALPDNEGELRQAILDTQATVSKLQDDLALMPMAQQVDGALQSVLAGMADELVNLKEMEL